MPSDFSLEIGPSATDGAEPDAGAGRWEGWRRWDAGRVRRDFEGEEPVAVGGVEGGD